MQSATLGLIRHSLSGLAREGIICIERAVALAKSLGLAFSASGAASEPR